MATERQIQANRANAAKSTGPKTPEGKRISSQNAAIYSRVSSALVPKGESLRRFNEISAALFLHFQPRNPVEISLVQTMAVARWRLLRMRGIQTAAFQKEMKRQSKGSIPAGSSAQLAANAFCSLAGNSRLLAQHRLEARSDRQYNDALARLLKLPEMPDSRAATETSGREFKCGADFESLSLKGSN